jgi:hypothetical protein
VSARCRHGNAWPTVCGDIGGFMWCPDCGAVRTVRRKVGGAFEYATPRWLYPRGREDVMRQLERLEGRQTAAPGEGER